MKSRWAIIALAGLFVAAAPNPVPAQSSEDVLYQAMAGAVSGDLDRVRVAWQQTLQPGGGPNRASDSIYYLYNCSSQQREIFLAGQEILAAQADDPAWKSRMILALLTDEVYELNALEGQNRFNKFTRVFNRASQSLSQLIMMQPQAAVSLIWDGLYSIKEAKPTTIKERKMIYLCRRFLATYETAPEKQEVALLLESLLAKSRAERHKNEKQLGEKAFSRGRYKSAVSHLELASLLDHSDTESSAMLSTARALFKKVEEARADTLGVSGGDAAWGNEADLYASICRWTALGNAEKLNENPAPPMQDQINFALAALMEKRGYHDQALQQLSALAQTSPQSPGGRASALLLANPGFNLDTDFAAALKEMSSERTKFIWTGRRSTDQTVYAVGSTAIQSAGNAATGVPILFGLDAAVRAVTEKFRTQVNVDGVIDAGARYRRRYPDSARSRQIAAELAVISKKAGDYRKSESLMEASGTIAPEDRQKLDENLAREILEKAKATGNLMEKKRLLTELQAKYPNTEISKKSLQKELSNLPPELTATTLVVPRKAILRDARFAQYLGLPTTWVDDSRRNGELDDIGLVINPETLKFFYRLRDETVFRQGQFAAESKEWLLTAGNQLRMDYDSETDGRDVTYRQKLPVGVEGGVGGAGVDLAPKVLPYPTSQSDKRKFE